MSNMMEILRSLYENPVFDGGGGTAKDGVVRADMGLDNKEFGTSREEGEAGGD